MVSTRPFIFHISISCDKTFFGYQTTNRFDLVTLALVFNLLVLIENFNLGYIFWMVCTRALIFHTNVPCDKRLTLAISFEWYILGLWHFTWKFFVTRPFHGYQKIYLVTLMLVFDLLIKSFNLCYILWMVCTRILIFHMSVPCVKTFPWVQKILML
jgi:hypothetical protein